MMLNSSTEHYLSGWQSHTGTWIEARKNEKVILRLIGDKVISGIIYKVGTKTLVLEVGQSRCGKMTTYLEWRTFKIEEIKDIAKFPLDFQGYEEVKFN